MRKIRLTFIIMIAIITLMVMPTNVFAVSGEGTEASPYIISTASDFNFMRSNLSAHYKLAASITLGSNWEPVGSNVHPFTGSFDGDGYIISGLALSQSGGSVYAGLFGFSTGDIKNVTLKMAASGITVSSSEVVYAGGIVGYNKGGKIENCSVEGKISVTAVSDGEMNVYAGMIAGRSSGIISSSSATVGSVTASATKSTNKGTAASDGKLYAGGIVGLSEAALIGNTSAATVSASAKSLTEYTAPKAYAGGIAGAVIGNVTKSQSAGNVVADATSSCAETSAYAGGIAGYISGNVEVSKAEGNVTAETSAEVTRTYAGGIVGYISGNITETYATGEISAETTADNDIAYAGGIAGLINGRISDSYTIGEASAVADNCLVGGIAGYTSAAASSSYYAENNNYTAYQGGGTSKTIDQLRSQETYEGWDFTYTWKVSDDVNDGCPYLVEISNVLAFFEDAVYTYDGTLKTLTASNIAENVTVTYSNNTAIDAGVYNVVATFVAEGHSPTQMTAKLIIQPAELEIKGLKVNDKEFDNTTNATIDVSEAVIEGIIEGDDVSIDEENS